MNLKHSIKNNLAFKITAVILSILLWFYVFYVFGAKSTKTAQIQIQLEGLDNSYNVSLNQYSINVTFSAPIQQIEQYEKNIRATMDLSNIGLGRFQRRPKLSYPKEVDIILQDPSTIEVTIEKIVTRDFLVKPVIKGKLNSGTILGEIILSPSKISIQGTESVLKTIDSVQIEIDISAAVSDLAGASEVKVMNSKKEVVEDITINTKVVKFQVPIITSDIAKTVPIIPNFIGSSSYAIVSFTITPQMVTLRGSVAILEKIQSISSAPIDLSLIQKSFSTEIDLVLPEGTKRENTTKVMLTVQTEEIISKTLSNIKIILRNNPFKNFSLSQDYCSVILTGRKSLVDSTNRITVYLDLGKAQKGLNEIPIFTTDIPSGLLVQLTPKKIDVKIID